MRKILIIFMAMLCLWPLSVMAAGDNSVQSGCSSLQARYALSAEQSYSGTAQAAILYELDTGTLVYAHNPDTTIDPTGLVKLMTALIVLEEADLEDVVTVQRSTLNSVSAGSVSAGLKDGEQITVEDLLYCVMVSSANDAAAVLAEHVAGSQAAFVDKMNARAATVGCVNTRFANVHGLQNENQHSTARELAMITEEALKNPQFVELFGLVNQQLPATNLSDARVLTTTNYLMNSTSKYYDPRVTGGKPAAASLSDRSVICTAETENGRYLCVIISAKARTSGYSVTGYTNFTEATALLDLGFKGFSVQQVLGEEQPFGMYEVVGGENSVVVGTDREVFALLPIDFDPSMLQFRDVKNVQSLSAPLAAGTVVGTLQICYGDIIVGEVELLARHAVAVRGSTIQTIEEGNGGSRVLTVLKWGGMSLLALVLVFGAGLLTLRQINRRRHLKKVAQRRQRKQEERNGLG